MHFSRRTGSRILASRKSKWYAYNILKLPSWSHLAPIIIWNPSDIDSRRNPPTSGCYSLYKSTISGGKKCTYRWNALYVPSPICPPLRSEWLAKKWLSIYLECLVLLVFSKSFANESHKWSFAHLVIALLCLPFSQDLLLSVAILSLLQVLCCLVGSQVVSLLSSLTWRRKRPCTTYGSKLRDQILDLWNVKRRENTFTI